MRIMIALLMTIGLSGATIVGLLCKKAAVSSAESTSLSEKSGHTLESKGPSGATRTDTKGASLPWRGPADVVGRTGDGSRGVRGGDTVVASGENADETILKLLDFTNEHVSRWEQHYDHERRLTVDTLKSLRDTIVKLAEGKGPLDLKAAAVAGRDTTASIQTQMHSVFAARREFNKALAELPEVYTKTAKYYRGKGTDEAKKMAELLELRAEAVRHKARLPALPDESIVKSLPTLASFFSEFASTFGQEPKAVTQLTDLGPNGEEALLRTKLRELAATIHDLLGSLTGGVTAPSTAVGVTAKQQEAFPLWDVCWFASRTVEGGVLVEDLRLNRDGNFERRHYFLEKPARSNPQVLIEQGRFTIVDNTLSFWNGDKLTERGRVEFESPKEFVLYFDMPRAALPASASGQIRYRSLARGH